jgi:NADPH2:quinone reductase
MIPSAATIRSRALSPGKAASRSSFPAGPKLPLNLTLLKSCDVVGVFWGAFARRDPKANAANIAELMQLYAKGAIKPLVSERYPLAKAADAIAKLASRKAMGKIVVTMD